MDTHGWIIGGADAFIPCAPLVSVLLVFLLPGVLAYGGEQPVRVRKEASAAETAKPLADDDLAGITQTLTALAGAMKAKDIEAVMGLLSPNIDKARREEILSSLHEELSSFEYIRMEFKFDGDVWYDVVGDGKVELRPRVFQEYASTSSGPGATASRTEMAYKFSFERVGDVWKIADSDFFDHLVSTNPVKLFSEMFAAVVGGVLAGLFWLWMTLDSFIRLRRKRCSIAVLAAGLAGGVAAYLLTASWVRLAALMMGPVAGLVYFFAVWLRRSVFEQAETG